MRWFPGGKQLEPCAIKSTEMFKIHFGLKMFLVIL